MDGQRRNRLHRLVLSLSGAHEEVLELVPSERIRFESLGWAILVTSGIAVVSMWFALTEALGVNGVIAFPVAVAWGLVIMGIDRWLIVSMPLDGGGRKFALAVPRLTLALLLGTLISTPLVLRIFQSEINAQISVMQQQSYNTFLQEQQNSEVAKQVATYSTEMRDLDAVIASQGATALNITSDPELVAFNSQLTSLNAELAHWTGLKNQYYTEYVCQLYGGSACPRKGNGPAAAASLQNYNDASQQVSTLQGEINQVQSQIAQRDKELNSNSNAAEAARYQEAKTQLPIVRSQYETAVQRQEALQASFYATNRAETGILIRLVALSQISNGDFSITVARFLLFLLFLVIECLPVTVKLLQRPGMYEQALQQARNAERRDFSKFYSFPSRIASPYGTPAQRLEAGYRLDEVWTPLRSLPEGDQPAMAADEPRNGAADRRPRRRPHQSADDDEPTGVTPPDVRGVANPVPAPDEMKTGREQVPEPSPDGGGIPLSWDEDE